MDELHSKELTDDSPFPFGKKWKGVPMKNVPVDYLHWVWHDTTGPHTEPVKAYIKKYISYLKDENKDLIWTK